ncbi:polyketide cyclase [Streptomyces mashuensis]|uniref:Polyketide cyclase n=1 Tax=Streptomyces mashuensis TaxID=33904 RepID=A0A919B8T7_9ACTN|nr:SRPBCC family protein [Streptomyces mashuensis]GHF69277.1 polyketide cyclase [Streptomyces mashuensis]
MAGHTDNSILIDAPLSLVWETTNDVASWTTLFSEYAEATVQERDGNRVRFRLALHPDENGTSWSWVSERISDPERHVVHARRVETGNFKYMWLFWEFTQEEGGVRMRWVQDFELKPGLPLDDAAMTERLNTNSTAQMRRIKERIEAAARQSAGAR